ncbi:MAG TPA: hypothetical protein VJ964_12850 [Balneolaceae bacterium]|nr:hypothetical protein [Balneolaceae bacterium]
MEKWYLPITILPGIGLLILSTSNLAVALNKEMEALLKDATNFESLISKKVDQLQLLTYSMTGFYISTALMVLSGIVSVLPNVGVGLEKGWGLSILLLGVVFIFVSLVLLIVYSAKAVRIRQEHFKQCLIDDQEN